jgi:5-methyltetrahydrofolate--homocysteine methyltransferase
MAWARQELRPTMLRIAKQANDEKIVKPQAVYGYWKAAAEDDNLLLFAEDGRTELARFNLPRQNRQGGLCIADFVRDVNAPDRDVVGLQIVTMGQRVADVAREWVAADRYQDYLFLHGFGVEMAEAMAEYLHRRIRLELGFLADEAQDMEGLLKQHYRGSRYSFGYPACPNLSDQSQIMGLLGADRIGVELSDEFQLHPEQSTSALVIHHPQAKYFSV